jgi:2-polyprenyl-6-methoxyphenol hydroxylase-like FAD-dependent oxidoreductase
MPDVTIIGAGPAGSIAAILLARGGWDVTIVEQHRFPRDKVCGECLSALGLEVLARAGLTERLRGFGPVELRRTVLVDACGREVVIALPRAMWGLSRSVLDDALLREAARAGARVIQPARCERIDADPPRLVVRDLDSNRVAGASPSMILVADGKAATMTGDLGVKAHFTDVRDGPCDAITLFTLAGHYIGLAPIEDGRWNLAMSVPVSKVKLFGGDMNALFEQTLRENTGLQNRMESAVRVGDWLASPLPRFAVRREWATGVIPLGNAAAALEPIGGEGMGLAMRSAEMVADELLAAEREHRPYDAAALQRRMRRLWSRRRTACRAGAMLLSRPQVAKWMTHIARPFGSMAMRLVGK